MNATCSVSVSHPVAELGFGLQEAGDLTLKSGGQIPTSFQVEWRFQISATSLLLAWYFLIIFLNL